MVVQLTFIQLHQPKSLIFGMFQLRINRVFNKREIMHFADAHTQISSFFNLIFVENNQQKYTVKMPIKWWEAIFGLFRLSRRALRLDKCNVLPTPENNLIIVRQGQVYFYDAQIQTLSQTLTLRQCRNVLHQSIGFSENGHVFFGEYGHNAAREAVPVYRSSDGGRSWICVYEFKPQEIKHVHGCYWDPYEQKIWTLTGDFANENWVVVADEDFKNVEKIGTGQQQFRACNLFFEADKVHWIMDSQLENSYHIVLDRKTRQIEQKMLFQGPVWYIKRLQDGYYLAATTQEIGAGVLDKKAHLMLSRDLENWQTLVQFEHDGLPMRYFKFGVIGFSDGPQSSNQFFMFLESLRGYDGKVLECSIEK